MDYQEAKRYLAQREGAGIQLGLSRMRYLLKQLGNPQDKLTFVHVAGTNGKGSVSAYISSVLAVSGYRVGRYVSPAVFCEEEIIQYEDEQGVHMMEESLYAKMVTEVADILGQMKKEGRAQMLPTRFEVETAMAFMSFLSWNCDVVVLEAGLGGVDDATNVIDRVLLSVITPIAMDHMAVLGNTMEEIAKKKAGIIRPKVPVVTMQKDSAALDVIVQTAKEKGAACHIVSQSDYKIVSAGLLGNTFQYLNTQTDGDGGVLYQTQMAGLYQVENASLAIEVCHRLSLSDFHISLSDIQKGIQRAKWRGRFEIFSENPCVILDGAHNPAGAGALLTALETLLPENTTIHGVMGVYRDKDYKAMVQILAPVFQDVVTITPRGKRGLDGEILARIWRENGCQRADARESVAQAVQTVKKRCRQGEVIVFFGSLSFMSEIRKEWR